MRNEIVIKVTEEPEDLEAELVERLRRGIVTFYYKKLSTGKLRVAHGTTNPAFFHYDFKTDATNPPAGQVNYWDVDKGGWRSVKAWNIISIDP